VVPADIDESVRAGESPDACVERLAREKARAAHAAIDGPTAPVVAADTTVVLDGRMLGKPADAAAATDMLSRLSGRSHDVFTAVAVLRGDREVAALNRSRVTFRALEPAEIEAYWRTGEPLGKAGSYAIQGLGAVFVEELHGSYSGVMGLPLFETGRLLAGFGYRL
jgi:septum formation protein